jgi:hypothetical protein
MLETAIFYVFAAVLLVSAAAIITARNPVRAVLCMGSAFSRRPAFPSLRWWRRPSPPMRRASLPRKNGRVM